MVKDSVEEEILQKERNKKFLSQSTELQDKIAEIRKQALIQVQQARVKTEEKLEQMKKIAERRKIESKKQISSIRNKIATKLLNEAKIGNISYCNPMQAEEVTWAYCEKNMKDDFQRLSDCKNSKADFCYTCCENEFGRIYEEFRDNCYLKCDDFRENHFVDWNKGNEFFEKYKK